MSNSFLTPPIPKNEPVKSYGPKSTEKREVKAMLKKLKKEKRDIPMFIGGKRITTNNKVAIHPPHEIKHTLGHYNRGTKKHVNDAIKSALLAKDAWAGMPWQDRAAIFLRAADLLCGPYRARMNAATMLGQSKNIFQAEIDAVCEMADFFRYNVKYMTDMYAMQPESVDGIWNTLEYRPLEGFIFALTPFNFTSIAANLCAAPAMLGNVIVWKPSETQIYSAEVIMDLFEEAGLPPGVINLVYVDGPTAGDVIFNHEEFAGLHFTGSSGVFNHLWKTIGNNLPKYKSYPRVVGETGGKDFIIAHPSAPAKQVATAIVRGAFELQGQKCSAASRVYLPESSSEEILELVKKDLASIKAPGSPEDMGCFVTAVIHEGAFDKLAAVIDSAKNDPEIEIVAGGGYDKSKGYFIQPTVLVTKNPKHTHMESEYFGPIVTVYIYPDHLWEYTLSLVDQTSQYALTGAVLAEDRYALVQATKALENCAGNFYINDKPSGAVVGQQPFGGARASGTNDKAGSPQNLLRWVSPRLIKETFTPATDYRYPFLS